MSSQWDLVGGNPAPGDPGWVSQQAQVFATIGSDATQSHQQLGAIGTNWSNSDWSGLAAESFKVGLTDTVLPDLQKMSTSYSEASSTLASFASELSELQASAQAALGRAAQAQSELNNANQGVASGQSRLTSANTQVRNRTAQLTIYERELALRKTVPGVNLVTDPTILTLEADITATSRALSAANQSVASAQASLSTARNAAADAQSQLNAARATIDEIRTQFQQAVTRACSGIENAESLGLHSLSFIGRLESAAKLFGGRALDILETVALDAESASRSVGWLVGPLLPEVAEKVAGKVVGKAVATAQIGDQLIRFGQDLNEGKKGQAFQEASNTAESALTLRPTPVTVGAAIDVVLWSQAAKAESQVNWGELRRDPGELNPLAPGAMQAVWQSEKSGLMETGKDVIGVFEAIL